MKKEYDIQEILQSIAELREAQSEEAKRIAELRESQRQTDKILSEKFAETDRFLSEKFSQTDTKLEKMGIHLGGISNNNGDVAEEFFYQSLKEKLAIAGTKYDDIGRNWSKNRNGITEEYDIILTNGKVLEIVEVKYKVHPSDIEKLERKYTNFKKLFPVYEPFEVRAAIAGMSMPEEVISQAKEKGFHALVAKGDHIEEV